MRRKCGQTGLYGANILLGELELGGGIVALDYEAERCPRNRIGRCRRSASCKRLLGRCNYPKENGEGEGTTKHHRCRIAGLRGSRPWAEGSKIDVLCAYGFTGTNGMEIVGLIPRLAPPPSPRSGGSTWSITSATSRLLESVQGEFIARPPRRRSRATLSTLRITFERLAHDRL